MTPRSADAASRWRALLKLATVLAPCGSALLGLGPRVAGALVVDLRSAQGPHQALLDTRGPSLPNVQNKLGNLLGNKGGPNATEEYATPIDHILHTAQYTREFVNNLVEDNQGVDEEAPLGEDEAPPLVTFPPSKVAPTEPPAPADTGAAESGAGAADTATAPPAAPEPSTTARAIVAPVEDYGSTTGSPFSSTQEISTTGTGLSDQLLLTSTSLSDASTTFVESAGEGFRLRMTIYLEGIDCDAYGPAAAEALQSGAASAIEGLETSFIISSSCRSGALPSSAVIVRDILVPFDLTQASSAAEIAANYNKQLQLALQDGELAQAIQLSAAMLGAQPLLAARISGAVVVALGDAPAAAATTPPPPALAATTPPVPAAPAATTQVPTWLDRAANDDAPAPASTTPVA